MPLDDKVSRMSKLRKIAKKALAGALITVTAPLSFYLSSIPMAALSNEHTGCDSKAAVFVTSASFTAYEVLDSIVKTPKWVEKYAPTISKDATLLAFNSSLYPPLTYRQNLNGNHVEWYNNLKKEEMLEVLKDPRINTVIFIGHGGRSFFCTSNALLTSEDMTDEMRKDAVIQHTCGYTSVKQLPSLKEAFKAQRGYSFEGTLDPITSYSSAWIRLFKNY